MSDIASRWGGGATRSLRDYYRGGAFVPNNWYNTGHIPTSGEIRMGHFTNQFGLASDDVLYGREARDFSIANYITQINGYSYFQYAGSVYTFPRRVKLPLNYWLKTGVGSGLGDTDSTGWFPPQYVHQEQDGYPNRASYPIYHDKYSNITVDAFQNWGEGRKNFANKTLPNGVYYPDVAYSDWTTLVFIGTNSFAPTTWNFGLENGTQTYAFAVQSNQTTTGGNIFSLFHINQPTTNIRSHYATINRIAPNYSPAWNKYMMLPGRWYVSSDHSFNGTPIHNTAEGATHAGYYDWTVSLPAYSITFISSLRTTGGGRKMYLDNFESGSTYPGLSGWGYEDSLHNINLLRGSGFSFDLYPSNFSFSFYSGVFAALFNFQGASTGRIYRSAKYYPDEYDYSGKGGPVLIRAAGLYNNTDTFGPYTRITTIYKA